MRIQLLPEDLEITAEMPEQDWCSLLPVLPALVADDRRETARQDLDTVNIMAEREEEKFQSSIHFLAAILTLADDSSMDVSS